MQYNSRGLAIIQNGVTKATFRGPPIVACSADYTVAFSATAWTNLQSLATVLDVPVFHIDWTHDGGPQTLCAILRSGLQKFYSAQAADSWLGAGPPSGPIFYFDHTATNPTLDNPSSGGALALQFAQSCVNFRRNHLYCYAMNSVWPVAGESLDKIQRPPIQGFWTQFASDPTWFVRVALQSWKSAAVPSNQQVTTAMKAGLDTLAGQENSYPGISRHILPTMAQNNLPFVYPWS